AAGADPNARAKGGVTPLHMAARLSETPAVVKVLLDAGADASAKTNKGKLPVELIPDDSPLRGTDVYWRLNEGRYR
ncbi:MAG: ankryin, partial [Synechococcus sp. SB0667_bin_8]|nr:ankryin [Synechococcus sp. SB0667_bin_8]